MSFYEERSIPNTHWLFSDMDPLKKRLRLCVVAELSLLVSIDDVKLNCKISDFNKNIQTWFESQIAYHLYRWHFEKIQENASRQFR